MQFLHHLRGTFPPRADAFPARELRILFTGDRLGGHGAMVSAMTAKKLLRLSLRIPDGWAETLLWQLNEDGWGAGLQERRFQSGHLDDEPVGAAGTPEVVYVLEPTEGARFQARIQQLAALYGWPAEHWSLESGELEEDDWEKAWRKRWKPFRCGSFVVHADFHAKADLPTKADDILLQLPIGSAFGTGGHPSTRIALRTLRRWWREQPFTHMLDVGTGSGILAVAAAKLGVAENVGMDPDPPSPAQATRMAEVNGVGEHCHFWRGTLESTAGQWPVIFANLQSGLLQFYSQFLAQLCEPNGRLFTGGFMDKNEAPTLQALQNAGFRLLRLHRHGRWRAAELVCEAK